MFKTVIKKILQNKWSFLMIYFLIFTLTYAVLYVLDFYPEPVTSAEEKVEIKNEPEPVISEPEVNLSPFPEEIIFDALDKTVTIANPDSRNIADLDEALLHGTVRHPDSAVLNENGNIFILGHSSYLPKVLNKNFQAFNGIQKLDWGDTVRLRSEDTEYVYRVERVYMAKASEVTVPMGGSEKRLTLATCNSFGSKDDRYMLEAILVSESPLASHSKDVVGLR